MTRRREDWMMEWLIISLALIALLGLGSALPSIRVLRRNRRVAAKLSEGERRKFKARHATTFFSSYAGGDGGGGGWSMGGGDCGPGGGGGGDGGGGGCD